MDEKESPGPNNREHTSDTNNMNERCPRVNATNDEILSSEAVLNGSSTETNFSDSSTQLSTDENVGLTSTSCSNMVSQVKRQLSTGIHGPTTEIGNKAQESHSIENEITPTTALSTDAQKGSKQQKIEQNIINILVIGRSQVGKSTLIHVLSDPRYEGSLATGMAVTKECYYHKVLLKRNEEEYTVNIVDTPGLQEVRRDADESRSNMEIQNLIATFLQQNMKRLHVVCFVSIAGKTQQTDMATFGSLMKFLGPTYSSISMLVLTHCDGFTNSRLEEFKAALTSSNYEECKEVVGYCQLGIHFHGALNRDVLETYNDEDFREKILRSKLDHIRPMRENLARKLINCAEQSQPIDDLLERLSPSRSDDKQNRSKWCQLL